MIPRGGRGARAFVFRPKGLGNRKPVHTCSFKVAPPEMKEMGEKLENLLGFDCAGIHDGGMVVILAAVIRTTSEHRRRDSCLSSAR